MRLIIFGLTVTSSWGNGHATLWRGLLKALTARGHTVHFLEKDVPYYAGARDGWLPPAGVHVELYSALENLSPKALAELQEANVAIVTSFCGDGAAACALVLQSCAGTKVFYDLDTPVTLARLAAGAALPYLPAEGLRDFDLVLSYTGGRALAELQDRLHARAAAPLYGWVDPEQHHPALPVDEYRCDLGYLGTFAEDRQEALEELFLAPAITAPSARFVLGGAQYPRNFPWSTNIFFVQHLPPSAHPSFFSSNRITLNVTRRAMASYGYCPSGRLFEAAACETAIASDVWEGLEDFFEFGTEILPVRTCADVRAAMALPSDVLRRMARAARLRVLRDHTAAARAEILEGLLLNLTERVRSEGPHRGTAPQGEA